MPNPFTRFINRSDPDSDLARFISAWDELEALLIGVYRRGGTVPEDEEKWGMLKASIRSRYPAVRDVLVAFTGIPTNGGPEPVLVVLELKSSHDMIGNSPILKLLPNIREAINRCLLETPD